MSQQPVEANVVLQANNSQYDQAMQSSAATTDAMVASVDKLTSTISNLTKSAGKISLGIAAADVAVITAATAAWASYENQMSRLTAQAAITTRTRSSETKVLKEYTEAVQGLRKSYGTSTGEGSQLVESISKLTEHKTQRQLGDISKIFTEMSKATGENATGLATSVLGLQKVMGNAVTSEGTRKYADQLTYLSQQTNMTASGLADFASQIAPVGRLLDLNQTQVTGVATAFAKAGQDGFTAANAFNQIVSNVAYATQSGSPDLAKYANLIGVTVDHFKEMEGSEKILQIFEGLNTMGPRAITELNRLGLDGMRTMRAITAMSNQTGGLRSAINEAQTGASSNSVAEGSAAAMRGMHDELAKIREEAKMIAEIFADDFGPAIVGALQGVEALAGAFRNMMEGPLGDVISGVAVLAGGIAGLAGGLLTAAGPLAQLATAALVLRGSGVMGMREGFRGASGVGANGQPTTPGGFLGSTGQKVADRGSWFQRPVYNAGVGIGGFAGGLMARTGLSTPPGGTPLGQRLAALPGNVVGWTARNIGAGIYSPLSRTGYNDPTQRTRMFSNPVGPLGRMFGSEETKQRAAAYNAERAAERVRTAQVGRDTSAFSNSLKNATTGLGTFGRTMASAGAQTAILGTKLAAAGVGKIGAGNIAGLAGLGLMASGVASDTGYGSTVTYGLMGSFMGPGGAIAGTAAGLYSDSTVGEKALRSTRVDYQDQAEANVGLAGRYQTYKDAGRLYDEQRELINGESSTHILRNPKGFFAASKNDIEGLFGRSQNEENRDEYGQVVAPFENEVAAMEKIAAAMNVPLSNDMTTRLGELDELAARVRPKLDELGLTFTDLAESYGLGEENKDGPFGSWTHILESITAPNATLMNRLSGMNSSGRYFAQSDDVEAAIRLPGDNNLQYRAINSQYAESLRRGMSYEQIIGQRNQLMAASGDPDSSEYMLNQAVAAKAQRSIGYQMPFMGRVGAYQQQAELFAIQARTTGGDPQQQEKMLGNAEELMASTMAQVQYFQQRLMQQKQYDLSMERSQFDFDLSQERMDENYNLQRERAQDDFHQQRMWQEQDYYLSRERAEHDYNRSRKRGQESFDRSMARSGRDYNIARRRQEADYQHSVMLMVQQSANQMYNIYERVRVQSTTSGAYMLSNARDQLDRMAQQTQNLDSLRSMGLSDDAIQQLGFTDASNAQQVARFVSEAANDPELIKQLNQAIRKRLRAAGELVTDESNKDWKEFERQYNQSRRRGQADFERSVQRARRDFKIQMSQMEMDFRLSMNRQAEDYEKSQDRQQKQFSKSMTRSAADYDRSVDQMTADFGRSMDRAAEDMAMLSEEVTGSLEKILIRSTRKLDSETGKQARAILQTFRGLKGELAGAGNDIMMELASIFGFKYTPKTVVGSGKDGIRQPNGGGMGPQNSFAAGGTLPGRSVGRDDMHFFSPEHGKLSLAGGESIMVPEWTDRVGGPAAVRRMNDEARYGRSYAQGGTIPAPGAWNQHESGYPWARWAGDINIPGSGDLGNPVRAWKDGVVSAAIELAGSYGQHIKINHPGSDERTLYAHLSRMAVQAGDRVQRGDVIGNVGSSGNSSGPHLHFEIAGGSSPLNIGSSQSAPLAGLLDSFYSGVEDAASNISLGGGLFEKGFWSKKLNRYARQVAKKHRGMARPEHGSLPPSQLNSGSNEDIVRDAMLGYGWRGQWPSLYQLVQHESGFNNYAQNPKSTAYGMFQFLDSTWAGVGGRKTSNPELQAEYGMRYIKNRYDDPNGAWDFWQKNNWYADGGIFADGPRVIGVGENGPETVLPLDERGAGFIAQILSKYNTGNEGKGGRVQSSTPIISNSVNTYRIDSSTNFTGNITVQANNPNELINQLKQRQRVMALSQASLGGMRT